MDQALNYLCRADFVSTWMCVEATGVERVFHDSLKCFDATLGAAGCCSAADSPSAVACAVRYTRYTIAFTLE